MGEGKKIVTEHYPAEKLPEELRRGIMSGEMVRVTVEQPAPDAEPRRPLLSFLGAAKGCYTEEEAVSYIRMLRDES